MIRSTVNSRHKVVVPLRLRGPGGTEIDVDAVVDTGFSGFLTLPPVIVSALNLPFRARTAHRLGDGTVCHLDIYDAEIEWDGVWLAVEAPEATGDALIGTRLLIGHEMFVEFVPGGVVDITIMP